MKRDNGKQEQTWTVNYSIKDKNYWNCERGKVCVPFDSVFWSDSKTWISSEALSTFNHYDSENNIKLQATESYKKNECADSLVTSGSVDLLLRRPSILLLVIAALIPQIVFNTCICTFQW